VSSKAILFTEKKKLNVLTTFKKKKRFRKTYTWLESKHGFTHIGRKEIFIYGNYIVTDSNL